jgi:hypothetical protein
MFQIRTTTSEISGAGFCGGRVRGPSSRVFVSHPAGVSTSGQRADYAGMFNSSSLTNQGPMLIWAR